MNILHAERLVDFGNIHGEIGRAAALAEKDRILAIAIAKTIGEHEHDPRRLFGDDEMLRAPHGKDARFMPSGFQAIRVATPRTARSTCSSVL